ncbi:hypothetical protein [Deferrisoma camini]|uniref:hypothetical protein n=1 Tax=Deferrisoma camini TaxID=1035120 RepID=UPI00046D7162|nr:hypothetical protein [Deferrisoma camini]
MFGKMRWLFLVLACVGLVVGCGSDSDSDPEGDASPPPILESPAPALGASPEGPSETSVPYSSILSAVTTIGGLGYAVYQNDGEVDSGLIMRVINPQGYLIQGQEEQTEMLRAMRGTLDDIVGNLDEIRTELDTIVGQMKKNHDELLNLIASPYDARSTIRTAEQEFIARTAGFGPDEADGQAMKDLYDLIMDTYGTWEKVNNIQDKITLPGAPILSTHTNYLIDNIGDLLELNNQDLINAYNSLEHYTYYWVNTMTRGTNLVIEAHMAGVKDYDETGIARTKYEWLKEYIEEDLNNYEAEYSFINNVWKLVITYTDPYYAHPDHDRSFLPEGTEDVLKRAEFFRRALTDQMEIGLIFYDIRTAQSAPGPLYARSLEDGSVYECSVQRFERKGEPYDLWDGNVLSYSDVYRITLYECDVPEGEYQLEDEAGETVRDYVSVERYDDRLQSDPEGAFRYGFGIVSSRHSAQLEKLPWRTSSRYRGIKARYTTLRTTRAGTTEVTHTTYPDASYSFVTSKRLDYPLEISMRFDPAGTDAFGNPYASYRQNNYNDKPNHFFNDKLSIYKEFVYEGESDHTFVLDTRFDRDYHVDTDIAIRSDTTAKTVSRMYLYDMTEGKTVEEISPGFDVLKEVHGDDLRRSYDDPIRHRIRLKKGHRYRIYIHMAALGEVERWSECEGGGGSAKCEGGFQFFGTIRMSQRQLRKMRLFY